MTAAFTNGGGTMPTTSASSNRIDHIYHAWDDALGKKDVTAAIALYAQDATIESPLVSYLLGRDQGIVRGYSEIRPFIEKVFQNTPPLRQRYRTEYFTNGRKVTWEYPHETPQGEQMDFVEVMDVNDHGLIQHHRVYWGWRGVGILQRGEYHR
jgi:SnoaL-like domain